MSEPADGGMNCERANDLLVDLACGELNPELTAAVRLHAEGCARCGPELAKLTRVMNVAEAIPLADPSRAVEERILRAAREALASRAGGTEAREPVRKVSESRGWFARLSEWALSPQVAMASVLLLMVGIGLYSLPIGREQESVAFEATPDERVPAAAPAASAAALPAEPSERTVEEQRERLSEELEAAAAAHKESAKRIGEGKSSAGSTSKLRRSGSAKPSAEKPSALDPLADWEGASGGAAKDSYNVEKRAPKAAPGAPRMEQEKKSAEPSPSVFAPAPPPSPAAAPRSPSKPSKAPSKGDSAAAEAAPAMAEGSAVSPKELDDKSSEWAQKSLNDGIAAARRGAYAQAVSLLSPLVNQGPESTRASARLWLARSLRGQGKCAEALRYYGPIVQQASVASDVISEAADCYEKTGETALAGKLRSRLGAQEAN